MTASVPLQASCISGQIPIQFPSHSKERQLGVLFIFLLLYDIKKYVVFFASLLPAKQIAHCTENISTVMSSSHTQIGFLCFLLHGNGRVVRCLSDGNT